MVELHRMVVLPSVMRWRIEALRDISGQQPHPRLLAANRIYLRGHISDGSYAAFMATDDGEECGFGGIRFFDALPSPDNPAVDAHVSPTYMCAKRSAKEILPAGLRIC